MKKIIIEPHYLGCLEYFCLLHQADEVVFEVNDNFKKQTYRNRTQYLGANNLLTLSIPLTYRNHTPTKDVRIDYSQRWVKNHWGALYSAYGKAPYFEFFSEYFHKAWHLPQKFLLDLLLKMVTLVMKIIQLNFNIHYTETYEKRLLDPLTDYRDVICPKMDFSSRNIYRPVAYTQLFGNNFAPNLSIADLIMCEGTEASDILQLSAVRLNACKR